MLSVIKKFAFSVALAIIAIISIGLPVTADGGPIVSRDLWAQLTEGQQIAVITLQNDGNAKIDLFISILDKTQQSHEINFFIPLGTSTSKFLALEQNIHDYNVELTSGLDRILRNSATLRQHAVQVLFSGTLLSNGAILVPLWTPMLLSGCSAAAPQPEATYQTESSQISIYEINEDTDLQALINTTGLDTSVQNTLERLVGQQIAVIKLQTHPQQSSGTSSSPYYSEPGLHLSWYSSLVNTESGPVYSYPLGTGEAWSKPIELTRVYIVAPPDTDFTVDYPKLGANQSGYDIITGAKITEYYQVPAYAIDEARGSFGRVWRATYTQSNPTSDIMITTRPENGISKLRNAMAQFALPITFLFAIVFGLAFWFLSWHFLMPRFLGAGNNGRRLQWYFALIYPVINAALMIFPGSILYFFFLVGLPIPSLAILFFILAGASIGFFELIHGGRMGVSRAIATKAFVYVSLISSGAYLVFSFAFAILIGII
jgi:hypothetical protein